jgi:hypothetical protein
MRTKDKEYRQRNHRPNYQHENPVEEHRDIMTRICAWDKSDQSGTSEEFERATRCSPPAAFPITKPVDCCVTAG